MSPDTAGPTQPCDSSAIQGRFVVGQTYRQSFKIDASTIESFARLSGDRNPIHLDGEEAKAYGYPRQVAHGALIAGFLSKIIGMDVPGPGAIWMSQSIDWLKPVFLGDEIELTVTIEGVSVGAAVLSLAVGAKNQNGESVMEGNARVKASERLTGPPPVSDGDRVALVTGGSRGIGAAVASRLAEGGLTVAVNYLKSKDSADHVVDGIRSAGGSAKAYSADVGDHDATADMVQEIVQSFGQIDVIVHGATPSIGQINVGELSYRELEPYLKTYLGGALVLMAAATPGMAERRFGRLIFLGTSYMFGVPHAGLAAYVAAKHGLLGLVKGLAAELGPSGITSNMVSPGVTVTDLTGDMPARMKELEARRSPMRRLASVRDTAEMVGFLASPQAGFINGANIPVTGGPV